VLQSWRIFTRTRTIAMFYLKCKIVRACDFFHYLTTNNLETFQRISGTKVTCTDNFYNTILFIFAGFVVSLSLTHSVKCSVFTWIIILTSVWHLIMWFTLNYSTSFVASALWSSFKWIVLSQLFLAVIANKLLMCR